MSTIEKTAVVEAVEDTAKTTKTTKKAPAKKAATKKAAEKVEAVETEKKTAARKKTATAKVYVQWEGTEVMIADIVEKIKFHTLHKNGAGLSDTIFLYHS